MAVSYWIQDQEFYRSGLLKMLWEHQQQYPGIDIKHWSHWFVHSIEVPEEHSMWFALQFAEWTTPEPPGIDVNQDDWILVNLSHPIQHIWT